MKKIGYLIFLLIFFFFSFFSNLTFSSQLITDKDDILELLNQEEITYSQYLNLLVLYDEKLDINQEDLFELLNIPKISFLDIISILNCRSIARRFSSIDELKQLLNDQEVFEKIKPFIKVTETEEKKLKFNSQVSASREIHRYQEIQNFENLHFAYGKKISSYLSLQEKDSSHKVSRVYLKIHELDYWQNITLGDYKAKLGQGLIVWENFKGGIFEISNKNKRLNLTLMKSKDKEDNLEAGDLKLLLLPKINIGGTYLRSLNKNLEIYGTRTEINLNNLQLFTEVAKNQEKYSYLLGSRYISSNFSYYQYFKHYDLGFPNYYTNRYNVTNDSQEEYFWEFNYYLNKLWQLSGYYYQESDLLNILDSQTVFLKLLVNLNPKYRFSLSKELKNKEGEEGREKTENFRLRLDLGLDSPLKTNIYFKHTQKTTPSKDLQINHYLRFYLTYKLTKNITIKNTVKFQDTDIKEKGGQITGLNVVFEQNILPNLKYSLKYNYTHYSKDYQAQPKEKIKIQLETKW
ncbi:DUF481 domain-containing protein [bacterium]|nr:DUF481 domain-containing protein [bacterium]MBU1153548.1 DUF481 domain-containing protein [bacterium]MBU1782621.1 DUF481 domain-containing protein [bacterium]